MTAHKVLASTSAMVFLVFLLDSSAPHAAANDLQGSFSISGTVKKITRTGGKKGVANVTITLPPIGSTVTNQSGRFQFSGLSDNTTGILTPSKGRCISVLGRSGTENRLKDSRDIIECVCGSP